MSTEYRHPFPNLNRRPPALPRSDYATDQEWIDAIENSVKRQFDMDEEVFTEMYGVTFEEAKRFNKSFTGALSFHACTTEPCVTAVDLLVGAKGKLCPCDCHYK